MQRRNYFDEEVADRYDEHATEMFEPAVVYAAVSFLAGLAGSGPALELGIGTGRIAVPLSKRGVRVHGIDLSSAMVARLQTKPGSEAISVTIGDFTTTRVDMTFSLAYLVYNTIENLTSQDDQVECFRNVASHLQPGGCFVIEVEVPQLQRLPPGETVRAFTVTPKHLGFDEFDLAGQGLVLPPLLARGGRRPSHIGAVSLCVAVRAGSDGATRRHEAARTLEQLGA